MLGGVDLGCFLDGPVVEPEDDIMIIIKLGTGNGHGLVGVMREDGERAGGIKGKAPNGVGINVMLIEDTLDGIADTSPNVVCRLFLHHRVS